MSCIRKTKHTSENKRSIHFFHFILSFIDFIVLFYLILLQFTIYKYVIFYTLENCCQILLDVWMYRVFSLDVTTAIFVSQNNETAAMLLSQTNPVGAELFSYANAFFCSNKSAYMLATLVKTLYLYQKLKFKAVIENA